MRSSFPPKPPPTRAPRIRTRLWGTPIASAMGRKCSITCVDTRMLTTAFSSTQASPTSGSRKACSWKGVRNVFSTITSACAKPASTSPFRIRRSATTLVVPWTMGAPGFSASMGS